MVARILCIAALWSAWGFALAADPAADEAQRRERLLGERAAAQARYEQTVRGCESGFVVTGCVNQAKAERRTTLDRVSRELALLDDAARKRRADQRRQRIAAKQQAAGARAAASAPEVQLRPPRPAASAVSSPRPARRVEPRSSDPAAADAEAQQRRAQSQQRRDRAEAHAEAVRQRNAERAALKAPAAALPVPVAASAGASGARAGKAGAKSTSKAPAAPASALN